MYEKISEIKKVQNKERKNQEGKEIKKRQTNQE